MNNSSTQVEGARKEKVVLQLKRTFGVSRSEGYELYS